MISFKVFKRKVLVIRFWRKGNAQKELCIFLPNTFIEDHFHKHQDIELLHLWGRAIYWRKYDEKTTKFHQTQLFRDCCRSFTIPRNAIHGANIGWTGLITISQQTWNTSDISSVTNDYHTLPAQLNLED